MALITVKDLSLGYDGRVVAKNINFEIGRGDYLCIIGENGSGKSTLMKALLRLKKPLSGSIKTGDGYSKNDVGYLPQQTDIQKDFPASVREIVLSGRLNKMGFRPFFNKKDKECAQTAIERLGLTQLADRSYRDLSGGQQQRVLLARALCATGTIIFLDEPVAGLDPVAMSEMYEIINRLNKEDGVTIVMISHDVDKAIEYADHVLKIDSGNNFFGTTEEYLKGGNA